MHSFDGEFKFEWEDTDIDIQMPTSFDDTEAIPENWQGTKLQAGIHATYARLKQLATTLAAAPPEIHVDYELLKAEPLTALRQADYEVTDENRARTRFTFRFNCTGKQRYSIREASRPERDERARWLSDRGLLYHVEDDYGSQWHFSILVRPLVPVSFQFEADIANDLMRITISNLDALETEYRSVSADAITPAMLGELEKMILRRANRFAEFTGNRVDTDVRARLREAIDERRRSRAKELGEDPGEAADDGNDAGGLKHHVGRKSAGAGVAEKPATPPAPVTTPVFVGPRDDDGALEWKPGAAAGQIAAPAAVSNAPQGYAWLITAGGVEDTAANLGKLGPPGTKRLFPLRKILSEGRQFRLRNQDGKIAFTGNIVGKFKGPEPINDFGLDHGCFRIEYLRGEEWMELRLKRKD